MPLFCFPSPPITGTKEDKLQGQLEDANKRISELVKLEERQRIARDLHDTLGQKLSLIGLKSDLAGKLISKNPTQAQAEINDVRQTARTALKEVRELVTQMRGTRLEDEMFRIKQILKAARNRFHLGRRPQADQHLPDDRECAQHVLEGSCDEYCETQQRFYLFDRHRAFANRVWLSR